LNNNKLSVNLDSIRDLIESRIESLRNGSIQKSDYLQFREINGGEAKFPSEMIEDMKRQGIYDEVTRLKEIESVAVNNKRAGNLPEANRVYCQIFRDEKKLYKGYIWAWCKVLLLAKNFRDLALVLNYLHAFNARQHIITRALGDNFEDHKRWGTEPVLDFNFNPAQYLRELCQSPLATKTEIEQRVPSFGGSEYWNSWHLTSAEYDEFLRYVG
jgi:hypothetical protein